jgi:PPP family 3-phenylpropionic acid transporter
MTPGERCALGGTAHDLPYWRLAGFYFFYFAYLGAFAPYFSLYVASLGANAVQIGMVMAAPQVVRIVAPYLWGALADASGRRLGVARLATIAGVITYVGLFISSDFAVVFAIVLVMSAFLSATLPLTEATTLAHLRAETSRYGRIRVWGSAGFIAAVLVVGYILDRLPISVLLWVMLVVLVGTAALVVLVPEAGPERGAHDHVSIGAIMRRPDVIALIAACALMAVAHGPYYTFYSIYLVDHGYSKGAIGWLWSLGVICEIAIFMWMPHLFRAWTARQILLASFALAAIRFLIIGWFADNLPLLVIAQVLHAATFGSFHAAAFSCVYRFFHGRHQARGQAIYTSLTFGLGGTIGGLYAGATWERWGAGATFTIAALCAAAGLALIARFLPEPTTQR